MKNAMKMVLFVVAVIGLSGCNKAPSIEAAASASASKDEWSTDAARQYGPECNWIDKNHKPITPGGCSKAQWAEWHKAH